MPLARNSLAGTIASLSLCCALSASAAGIPIKNAADPARIGTRLLVVGSEVLHDQWPGTLSLVHAPAAREMALPGQCISVAVWAAGDGGDALLGDAVYSFEVEFAGQTREYDGVRAALVKHIRPESDGVGEHAPGGPEDSQRPPRVGTVSLASFDFNWCVPGGAREGKAVFSGSATFSTRPAVRFGQASLPVASLDKAVRQGTFKNRQQLEEWFMGYHRQPNPARLLAACRMLARDDMAFALNVRTFLIEVLKSSPDTAADLEARLPDEQPEVRGYALYLLQEAGYDVAPVLAHLPEEEGAFRAAFLERIPPLTDPYDLQVEPAQFDTPERMDALWSIFLVTGRQRPVRAIAELLTWRDDYPAVLEAQNAPKQHQTLTAALGRGVCYMTAGWSLGSFAQNDPLVADFVDAWQADPATPGVLREELSKLHENEAFRRAR